MVDEYRPQAHGFLRREAQCAGQPQSCTAIGMFRWQGLLPLAGGPPDFASSMLFLRPRRLHETRLPLQARGRGHWRVLQLW